MIWIEVHADYFKRIIQAEDFADAIGQFKAMHPQDKIIDAKRI